MNLAARLLSVGTVVAALGVLGASHVACSSSSSEDTSGKRIALTVKVTGSPEANAPFTNSQGWTITLTKAMISTGALYYYDGATIFSHNAPAPKSPGERIWEALVEKPAYAHPGHYIPGNAKGQYLAAGSADLRSEAILGTGDGVSGTVRSATFTFGTPAAGPFAGALGSHVAVLEGSATKGTETRVFRSELDAADIVNTKNQPAVEGCPFEETDMESDGTVTVTIKIAQWFDQVEFDGVPASTDGAPVTIPATAIGHNELVRGLKEGLGYTFRYTPN
jgi:hypothetical protein